MECNKMKTRHDLTRRDILRYGLYGGLAVGLSPIFWFGGCSKWQSGKRPNIILITLDTTRADHLSCYGYKRQTSPNLDLLAKESVLYTRAIATSSWTLPSHASIFTGKFTTSHGARKDPNGPLILTDAIHGPQEWQKQRARGLSKNELTLARILRENGYVTAAVVGGPWMKKIFGLNEGFDFYDDAGITSYNGRPASQITSGAINWIEKSLGKKFFLFLNYFDPHFPFEPPEGFATAFLPKNKRIDDYWYTRTALYDAEILYMDHYIGKLIQNIKANNLYENTLIIVTADHGELLGEHGKVLHGNDLYQEEIHVPLMVRYPGTEVPSTRKDTPVQLLDIFALILDRLGLKLPEGIQAGVPPQVGHPILSETYPLPTLSSEGSWRAIFEGDFKFIWNSKGHHMLFDCRNDPFENINLIWQHPQQAQRMEARLNNYLMKLPAPGPAQPARELDSDTKKALKSLGYVN